MPPHNDSDSDYQSTSGADWRASLREAGPYLHLGCGFAGVVVTFVLGGLFIDQWLGTTPLFILLGLLLAFVGIMAQVIKVSNR